VAFAALKGESTLTGLAEQFDIHLEQFQERKKRLVEYAVGVFGGSAIESRHNDWEVEKLHAKIGNMSIRNGFSLTCM